MKPRAPFPLNSAAAIRAFFRQSGKNPLRRWGQNFLIDANWRSIIASQILQSGEDPLLEIGPGGGALTRELLKAGRHLYALEIDPLLIDMLANAPQLQQLPGELFLLQGDARKLFKTLLSGESLSFQKAGLAEPIPSLNHSLEEKKQKYSPRKDSLKSASMELREIELREMEQREMELREMEQREMELRKGRLITTEGEICHICGNLPYYISTNMLTTMTKLPYLKEATFLLQKEFAQRIVAADSRSSLGIFLHNHASLHVLHKIARSALFPVPTVESLLISYKPYPDGPLVNPAILEQLLRLSFAARRKKIRNSWQQSLPIFRPDLQLKTLLALSGDCGIDPEKRAEEIAPNSFYSLAAKLAPLLANIKV